MKKILLLFLLLSVLFLTGMNRNDTTAGLVRSDASATNQLQHPLHTGLVFDMPMTLPNIRGATTTLDISANTNHGTASNCTIGADYTTFNGTTSYVDCGDIFNSYANDLTVSFWINPATVTSQYIFSKYVDGSNRFMLLFNGDSKLEFSHLITGAYRNRFIIDDSLTSSIGSWIHILMMKDVSTGWFVYVDNVLQSLSVDLVVTWDTDLVADLEIGRYQTNYGEINLAHLRVWNRVLTTAERTAEYNRLKSIYQP